MKLISRLKNAGLDSVPGASDLLVDRIRKKVSPRKIGKDLWCEVMYCSAPSWNEIFGNHDLRHGRDR